MADKLLRDGSLLALAETNLAAAKARGTTHPQYLEAWRRLLALPLEQLLVKLVDESQEMRDLRQSPFAGVLTARASAGRSSMRRVDLEHLLRAAGQIDDEDEIIVLGSHAILVRSPTRLCAKYIARRGGRGRSRSGAHCDRSGRGRRDLTYPAASSAIKMPFTSRTYATPSSGARTFCPPRVSARSYVVSRSAQRKVNIAPSVFAPALAAR